jgi:hypothetical protein
VKRLPPYDLWIGNIRDLADMFGTVEVTPGFWCEIVEICRAHYS